VLFLCLCGMAVGLAIDSGRMPLELVASLCSAGGTGVGESAGLHLTLLPATHALMVAGGLVGAAIAVLDAERPARTLRDFLAALMPGAACAAGMLAGMIAGGWLGPPVAAAIGLGGGPAELIGAMTAGMVLGMIPALPFCRRRDPVSRPAAAPGRFASG
jgi:hypothetical protein